MAKYGIDTSGRSYCDWSNHVRGDGKGLVTVGLRKGVASVVRRAAGGSRRRAARSATVVAGATDVGAGPFLPRSDLGAVTPAEISISR